MTYANRSRRPPPPAPLTPTPAHMPIAIDTAVNATAFHLFYQGGHDTRRQSRVKRRQLPIACRARSHSPPRRSPKLRHTNGRLHGEPDSLPAKEGQALESSTRVETAMLQLLLQTRKAATTTHHMARLRHGSRPAQHDSVSLFPARNDVRRSISCLETEQAGPLALAESAGPPARTPRRFTIFYRDEALRESCAKNTRRMIENAKLTRTSLATADSVATAAVGGGAEGAAMSNQQRIALKALKYRNLLHRMHEIDDSSLNDPSFDVLECLGVHWRRV